ncbi:phage tail protein [Archangium violaceum]|uniref:phage tail protein n=1 Tax=Archangium violaceum TaxID=83451 RepID=UPI002B325115|nr:phage tail protein [Archangium gephyra]
MLFSCFQEAQAQQKGVPSKPAQATANPTQTPTPPNNMPIGTIVAFAGEFNELNETRLRVAGWLPCDGRALRRSEFKQLFQVIGENFGEGYEEPAPDRGNDTGEKKGDFNVPDFRGRFLRGTDSGTNRDPDAARRTAMRFGGNTGDKVGSVQQESVGPHDHPAESKSSVSPNPHKHRHREPAGGGGSGAPGKQGLEGQSDTSEVSLSVSTTTTVQPNSGKETRPKNINANWIIQFR